MAKKSFSISQNIADGLTDSIKAVSNHKGELNYEMMSMKLIEPDPDNPRKLNLSLEDLQFAIVNMDLLPSEKLKQFESLKPLIDSIKKVGVRNAIEVYKFNNKYRLISGERRWLASAAAGREFIPVHICDKPNNFDLRYLQWVENIHREDLNLWEKYQNLNQIKEAFLEKENLNRAISAEELCQILGISQRQSYRYLSLLYAAPEILMAVKTGKINNLKVLDEISKIKDKNACQKILENIDIGLNNENVLKQISKAKTVKLRAIPKNTHINLGVIDKPKTMQAIFNILLSDSRLINFESDFNNLNWASTTDISNAFKRLINLVETHIAKEM